MGGCITTSRLRLIEMNQSMRRVKKMTAPMQISAKAPIMRSYSSHQSSLPKLPVPQFQKTLQKYLLAVQPLLTEEEFQHTKQIVEEFGKPGGQGEELQMKLVQRSQKYENWLSEWWLNAAYLDYRTPVVVHSSPGVAFPLMDFKSEKDQLSFAAKLICGALDYKDVIDREKIPIDMMGGHPLCMDQYYKLLSSCRIPGTKRDSIVVYPGNKSNAPRHIVVAHNNHFFELDVYHSDGKHLTMEELFNQLEKICSMSPQATDPVGILTTEHRNTWGKVYKKLKKLDKVNKKSLEKIEKAILLLCLDRPLTYDPDDRLSALGRQVLHGDGSHGNGGNRWVDKTIQLIVGRDGNCGLQYEHAPAEGPPIMALISHILDFIKTINEPIKPSTNVLPLPKELVLKLDNDLLQDINIAKDNLDVLVNDVTVCCFQFKPFGKNFPKKNRMSPDAFIQVALQLAYYKIYKRTAATYESASLRRFRLGRTDTIRSCTNASLRFCKAMLDSNKTPSERYHLLRAAVEAHKTYTNQALVGEVIDRHLLGLKLTAIESGQNVPEIFMDPAYQTAMHFKISTSQVPSTYDLIMCFGPVVPDGYGVCYNPHEEKFNFSLTSFNSSPETNANKLAKTLADSLLEMQSLTVQNEGSKL